MGKFKLLKWCNEATAGIRFRKDRNAVYEELFQHVEERYYSYVDQGMEDDIAEEKAIQAMGSAAEIAPQLAALYRPFWPRLMVISRYLLLICLCVALFTTAPYIANSPYERVDYSSFDPFNPTGEEAAAFVRYLDQDSTARSDGYYLSIKRAAEWQDVLYFEIEAVNPIPWAQEFEADQWFWAKDSLGNDYPNRYRAGNWDEPLVYVTDYSYHTNVFTYVYCAQLANFVSQDAEWVDLHYDRDGRDVVLRIDLTGTSGLQEYGLLERK